ADKDKYLKMIYNKTAVLIEASARCGAILANLDEKAFGEYGKNLGLAFQMIDDILDIKGDEKTLGKPAMNDFKEGKTTLPYIYL
ncbi:hexaprenyl-diphosphate synthase, partial [Campylobacter jejuni]|nr:hexaprenyl-diphosphate synthase [Campylobacter jejuni]